MKTNQLMIRDEYFVQRTCDGYFNANILLDKYNSVSGKKAKQMQKYKNNESYKEFLELLNNEGIEKPVISTRGINGGTWMHPKLFIDFAMWVSVMFKSKVIDMVMDGLIFSRNDAGDYYKEMCAAILDKYQEARGKKPAHFVFINEANIIKKALCVSGLRNELTKAELDNITTMQKFNTKLIEKGIGKDSRIKQLNQLAEAIK